MASLTPRGPFSLRAAAEFGFGPNEGRAPTFDGAMRLAFPLDGGRGYAGAVLRQPNGDGPVDVELAVVTLCRGSFAAWFPHDTHRTKTQSRAPPVVRPSLLRQRSRLSL